MHVDPLLLSAVGLSVRVACVSSLFVAVVGTAVAHVLATRRFLGRSLIEALVTLPLVLPPTVIGYYLILLFGRAGVLGRPIESWTGWNILFTWQAAALASAVVSFPLMVRTAQAAIESVDPALVDTALTLGYSRTETAFRVTLPLAWRGLLAGVVLSFARGLGEFGATLMVAGNIPGKTSTLPLVIYGFAASGEWDQANLVALLLTALSGVFLVITTQVTRRSLGWR